MEQPHSVFAAWAESTRGAGGYGNSPGFNERAEACTFFYYRDDHEDPEKRGAVARDDNGVPLHAWTSPNCRCFVKEDEMGKVTPSNWTPQQGAY